MASDLRSLLMGRRPPEPPSRRAGARQLLLGCWTPLWRSVGPHLPDLLIEALGPLAKDEDPEAAKPAKGVLLRDRRFAAEYELAMKEEFEVAVEVFAQSRPGAATPGKGVVGKAPATLSLIEYGDMELRTLVEASAARVRNAAAEADISIRLRLANAVGEPEIRSAESPISPAIFFRALHSALTRLDVLDADTVMSLLPRFDAPLVKVVADAFRTLDVHLAALGLANEVTRSTVIRNTGVGGTTRMGSSTLAGSHSAIGGGSGLAAAHAEEILQALYGRLQLLGDGGGAGAIAVPGGLVARTTLGPASLVGDLQLGVPGGGIGVMPAGGAAGSPTRGGVPVGYAGGVVGVPGGVIGSGQSVASGLPGAAGAGVFGVGGGGLAGAGGAVGGLVALPGAPLMINAELLGAINEFQKLGAMALQAVQLGVPAPDAAVANTELRNKLMEKASAQVDKLTIEIVGLLFDRINADKHVPQPIKELLQRLEFPLIKVAVTDPALFVSPDQPARRLMDRIASSSIGWTPEGEANALYLQAVQKAVHAVLAATDEGITAFERSLADFETYLEEERTRDDDPVQRAKRALAEAEDREIMAINAAIKIRTAFDGLQIESYLREFLLQTWVRVLVAVHVRDRDDNTVVRRYLGIVPDLVWSVQPKLSQDERKRLVGIIPPVLGALREGLMLIDWPKERMQEFFSKLMNSHALAVKALELAHGNPGTPLEPSTLRIRLDGVRLDDVTPPPNEAPVRVADEQVRQALSSAAADVQHLAAPDTAPTVAVGAGEPTDADLDARIALCKRGDWFNLRLGDVTERVQLRWISPRKTLYLFMPADGRTGHSLSPESLRAFLRAGDLGPVEAEPLFERAVTDVVQGLQQVAPAAAH